jgi:hypothetical protein
LNIERDINSYIKNEVSINTEYDINLNDLEERLKIIYPEKKFRATWDIK